MNAAHDQQTAPETTAPETTAPETTAPETTDELRADIEQTREELAQTAQALGDKFDVKHRARTAIGTVRGSVEERVAPVRERIPAIGERIAPVRQRARAVKVRATDQWDRDPVPIVAGVATVIGGVLVLGWRARR